MHPVPGCHAIELEPSRESYIAKPDWDFYQLFIWPNHD
jgi:hypothetical protein